VCLIFRLVRASTNKPLGDLNFREGEIFDFDDYYPYETIVAWMESLAASQDYINIVNIGNSYEGRQTKVLTITKAGPEAKNVWVESGKLGFLCFLSVIL